MKNLKDRQAARSMNTFDYTTLARSIALRFPRTNFLAIQVTFWVTAFLILATVMHFTAIVLNLGYEAQVPLDFPPFLLFSVISGVIYGTVLGVSDPWLEQHVLGSKSLGVTILLQAAMYFAVLIIMMTLTRFLVWEYIIVPGFYNDVSPVSNELAWHYYAYIVAVYTFPMGLVIGFINQMNKKFGPGVLVPLLLGKYRNPREENRIFMFMDLESSTSHAENLGHLKYSAFIRDSFLDINRVVSKYRAEIYQYVGDEVVISWPSKGAMSRLSHVEFFFDCQLTFRQREAYYNENYGVVPRFKAGLHQGIVTAVEVGDIKRDIAYHGDTLNTASRIQSKCKEYGSDLLISDQIETGINWTQGYKKTFVGQVSLRGKHAPISLFDVRPEVS